MAQTFETWMAKVDAAVLKKYGVSVHDLPDLPFYDYWIDGITPSEVAKIAMQEWQ